MQFGGVLLAVTITVSEAVHPFAMLVTVTIYVPALATVIAEVVAPPGLHMNVVLAEAVAVSITEVTWQVMILSAPAFTEGGVLLSVTTTTSEAVQPFPELVAVTV